MRDLKIRVSDKSYRFLEAKCREKKTTQSIFINEMIEGKIFAEGMKAAKEAKKQVPDPAGEEIPNQSSSL